MAKAYILYWTEETGQHHRIFSRQLFAEHYRDEHLTASNEARIVEREAVDQAVKVLALKEAKEVA